LIENPAKRLLLVPDIRHDLDWRSLKPTADHSGRSFLFTLKNAHNFPARSFSLKPTARNSAIYRNRLRLPNFGDIGVSSGRSGFTRSFGLSYANDSGVDAAAFFTGVAVFAVREIEVFEIQD
jgi:hypothetical protein